MPKIKLCLITQNAPLKELFNKTDAHGKIEFKVISSQDEVEKFIDQRLDGALIDKTFPVQPGKDLPREVQIKLGKDGYVGFVTPEMQLNEVNELLKEYIEDKSNNLSVSPKLIEDYKKTIPEKLTTLKQHLKLFIETPTAENFTLLRTDVHKMAGSAGLFGYKHVSFAAKDFEKFLLENQENLLKNPVENSLNEYTLKIEEEFKE